MATGRGKSGSKQPILVAVDFSPDSLAALKWAIQQADLLAASIIVLHAIHDPADSPGFYSRPGQSDLAFHGDVAREMMADFLKQVARLEAVRSGRVEISERLIDGLPAGRITELARTEAAQMIVVGNRGRSRLSSLLLGSVAEQVIREAEIPVVVVKAERSPAEPEPAKPAQSGDTPEQGT
ncbi:MAG: universal stress protein [Rhodobacteraceae bacterium]|nr:universal stress protein [Paracoccaceae bacterium]